MLELIDKFVSKEISDELDGSLKKVANRNIRIAPITESTNTRKTKMAKKPKYKKAKFIHHESVNSEMGKGGQISGGDFKSGNNPKEGIGYILLKVPDPRTRIKSNAVTQGKPIPSTRPFKAQMTEK